MAITTKGVMDLAGEIATGLYGNGAAQALKTNLSDVATSRVMQKESAALGDLLNAFKRAGAEFDDAAIETIKGQVGTATSREVIAKGISRAGVKDDMAEFIDSAIKTYTKGGGAYSTYMNKITDFADVGEAVGNTITKDPTRLTNAASEYLGKKADGQIGLYNMAMGYFMDAKDGAVRRKIAGTTAVGGAVGYRLLSGGSLTRNNRGERDIAGIPFI